MINLDNLQDHIRQGRSKILDWATEDAPIAEIAETMVAFANSSGGLIVMGAEHSTIHGVTDMIKAGDRLIEAALSTDPPLIIPLPLLRSIQNKTVVIAQIPSGMPHVYAYEGRYLVRDGAKNMALTPRDLRRLMIERGAMSFETNQATGATLDDINWDQARAYASSLSGFSERDVQQVLLKRGCLLMEGDELYPTNAGILLFGKDPQRFIIGSDLVAARFASETMGDTFSRYDIGGTLPEQIRRLETFLVDHLRKEVTLSDKMQREELYEYPMEAAREVVVNAVAHRDYSIRGDNIRIFIFSNRMEVYSPGGLPGPMTLQNLREERFSRNPIIVQVLADMNFIERLGYGVDRVLDLMRSRDLREPDFEERRGGFQVVLYNAAEQVVSERSPDKPRIVLNGVYDGKPINERQEAALVYLLEGNYRRVTNGDLKEMFPDVHPETLRRDMADLVNRDILVKIGQKRGSYYMLVGEAPDIDDA